MLPSISVARSVLFKWLHYFLHILLCTFILPRCLQYTLSFSWDGAHSIGRLTDVLITFSPVLNHMACSCAFCKGSLRARFIATWSSPLETFSESLVFHWNDTTSRLKVCQRPKSAQIQSRRLLRDCGSSLTRGHWAAGAAVNDCRGTGDYYGSLRDTVTGEVLGAEL